MATIERQIKNAIKTAFNAAVTAGDFEAVAFDGRIYEINLALLKDNPGVIYVWVAFGKVATAGASGFEEHKLTTFIGLDIRLNEDVDTADKSALEAALDQAEIDVNDLMLSETATWNSTLGETTDRAEKYKQTNDSWEVNQAFMELQFVTTYHIQENDLETAFKEE